MIKNYCFCRSSESSEREKASQYDLVIISQVEKPYDDTITLASLSVAHHNKRAQGRGYEIMNKYAVKAKDPFIVTESGDIAALNDNGHKGLFDYSAAGWKDNMLLAVEVLMRTYDGVFFDNCTANWVKQPDHLSEHLQAFLLDVRREHPDAYFIANSRESWQGVNGDLLEGREDYDELVVREGQVYPNLNMLSYITADPLNDPDVVRRKQEAESRGALFYACESYQKVTPLR